MARPVPERTRAVKCSAAAALLVLAAAPIASEEPAADPPARPARLAARSLLLDITHAGERLVAVGERGHVLQSDDAGETWKQAELVPTSAMLTGVHFADEQRGWAVGHDEVVIRTRDGGRTWEKTHYAPETQRPLHAVWFADAQRGIAIGAYGTYLVTADGGETWLPASFDPAPLDAAIADNAAGRSIDQAAMDEAIGSEFHLNALSATGKRLYIAAEAGRLFRSDDAGATWITLPSPYEGSFFGVLPLAGEAVLAFGLRGKLFRSEDAGATWKAIPTGSVAMLTDAVRVDARTVVIVGLSGVVLVSRDGARSFTLLQQADRRGLAAVLAVNGSIVTVGEGGTKVLTLEAGEGR